MFRWEYNNNFSVIVLEMVHLPDGLDLGGHASPIFSIHQLGVGQQHQNLFAGVMLWPLHLLIGKFLRENMQ